MSDANYFSKDYNEARAKFRAHGANEAFKVPSKRDQDLTVDYLEIHPTKTKKTLLVLTSGVHGSEASTGSAIQDMFLSELRDQIPREHVGLLAVHALNPFGFKYNRRSTENNVNLNRNFGADASLFQTPNPRYETLARHLEAPRKGQTPTRALVEALAYVGRCLTVGGFNGDSLTRTMAHGQFKYPKALEFGGMTWEPQIKHFIEKLKSASSDYENIVIFDLHTGLGDRYELHLIPVDDPKSRDQDLMDQLFEPKNESHLYKITDPDAKGFYETAGDLNSLPPKIMKPGQRTLTLTFEFGTLGNGTFAKIQSLARVLNENRGFHNGYVSPEAEKKSNALYMEMFVPDEEKWRENVIQRMREVLKRVLSRL